MLNESINKGCFLPNMIQGMIALFYKKRIRSNLINWKPIILLNISYTIYTKVLQLRLQLSFVKIINKDQFIFIFFLRLDFLKAYDIIEWNFFL